MKTNNGISLICFVVFALCWLPFMFPFLYAFDFEAMILAPAAAVVGMIFAIKAVRSGESKLLAWILFTLHVLVIASFLVGFVYLAFFWNPRFF